ncbi:transposase InsO family protein [Streptomyces sp. AK010]|nr:transposase InsO family protein [Streptomyces sp. AK010]
MNSPTCAASWASPSPWARSVPPADNAACESFHATLKRETLRGAHHYPGTELCRRTVFRWLTRYNTRRRHSANGHLSPVDYEHQHQQESDKLTLAA